MKKTTKAIIILGGLCAAALTLAACGFEEAPYRDLAEQSGGIVKVIYEQNGGRFANLDGAGLIDSYPLSLFDSGKGVALIAPGDPKRDGDSANKLNSTTSSVSRDGYSLIGWYKECREKTRVDETGEPLDEDGVLCSMSGKEQGNVYAGMWNFEGTVSRLTLDMCERVSEEGETPVYEYHLWAAWQPSISFNFYRPSTEKDREQAALDGVTIGDWIEYAEPLTVTASNRYLALPFFSEEGGGLTLGDSFPDASQSYGARAFGYTLDAIYRDPVRATLYCKDEGEKWLVPDEEALADEALIERDGAYYIVHHGGVDYESGYAYNTTINLYTTWKPGRYFRIKDASQMTADENGYYFIENDLTFTSRTQWNFGGISFRGQMTAKENVKIGGIVSTQAGNLYGGVFASLEAGAVVKNITFEDVTLNLSTGYSGLTGETAYFGLFAGMVSPDSVVEDVSLTGTLLIGGDNFLTYASSGLDEVFSIGYVSGNGETKGISDAGITAERVASLAFDENYDVIHVYKLQLAEDRDKGTIGIIVLERGNYDPAENAAQFNGISNKEDLQ